MLRDCDLLHEVVECYPVGSDKSRALQTAILAYSWLFLKNDLRAEFIEFQEHLRDPLTEERIQSLKNLGINLEFQEEDES